MPKLKLSAKEIKAVKDSIKHWQRDILKPLQDGNKIDSYHHWVKGEKPVMFHGSDCALCDLRRQRKSNSCESCSYFEKYGYACSAPNGTWYKFYMNSNLRTCKAMIKALEDILK